MQNLQGVQDKQARKNRKEGALLVVLGGICWGFIGIFVQAIGPAVDPFTLSALRLGIASAFMIPVIIYRLGFGALRISGRNLAFFAFFGMGYWMVYQMLYFSAIQMTSASIAVVMLYTAPFFVILLARIFLGEKITLRKVTAGVTGIAGVWLMFKSWTAHPSPDMILGALLALGAGFCFATYFIFVKKALLSTHPFITAFYSMLFGCIFLTLLSLIFFREKLYFCADLRTIGLIFGLSALSTTLGGTLNIMGLEKVEAGEAGVFALVEPITTLAASWILFGDVLQGMQLVGAVLVLSGGYMIYKQPANKSERGTT